MNKVLIGITSWYRLSYTKECLEALELTDMPFDCVICDNGSPQDVVEYLKTWDGKVLDNGATFKVHFFDKNYGVGKVLNTVLDIRKPEQHFLKLDNDFIVPTKERIVHIPFLCIPKEKVRKDWLFGLVDVLENSNGSYSQVGLTPHSELDIKNNFVDENWNPKYYIETTTGNKYAIGKVPHLLGACSMYRADLLKNKRFSEERIYGFEDTLLSQTLRKHGEAIYLIDFIGKHIDLGQLEETKIIAETKTKSLRGQLTVPKFPGEL